MTPPGRRTCLAAARGRSVSVSGAQMVGGADSAAVQAGRICQQAVKPDRIVLLLGANDVCNRSTVADLYPVDTFRAALKAALDALAQIGARIDAYNHALAAEVADADAAHGGLAGVRFTTDWVGTAPGTSAGTHAFGPADVSDVDCFHPSVTAQRRLACIAWETWELGDRNVAACLQ